MEGLQTTVPCPSCGVAVQVGYPKCPKCQTVMPSRRTKRQTFRDENLAGGTSVAPEDTGGSGGWILALVLLLVGGGVAVYFATRGGAKKEEPAAEDQADDDEDEDDTTPAQNEGEEETATPGQPARPVKPGATPAQPVKAAVMAVDDALRAERLWAKVSAERTVLVIESSLCGDPGVKSVISGEADVLRTAGFVSVRCQSPNGQVDFESGL